MTRARAASQDKPLDPEDVKKCLQKFRAYEARQEMMVSNNSSVLIRDRYEDASNALAGI